MKLSGKNKPLLLAATLTLIAALAHLGCIIFGASWYSFMGAGEQMAQMAASGSYYPAMVTSVLVLILSVWAIYGYSAAGVIVKLPLMRTALVTISSVYLLRALAVSALMPMFPDNGLLFWLISSAICLLIGGLYALGTFQYWQSVNINKKT